MCVRGKKTSIPQNSTPEYKNFPDYKKINPEYKNFKEKKEN